jgi:predicted nucleotidyltransferase
VENEKIIKSFNLKPNLNPKIWENYKDPNKAELKNEIRTRLLEIANEFIDFVEVDIIVTDIILMGSLVNYNWSEYSDFDLHILSDLSQYSDEKKELYLQLFDLKKTIFNYQHDIKIKGYDVELYLQDESSEAYSDGVYSILNDEFIKKPSKTDF